MISYEPTPNYFVHTAEGMPTMPTMHYHNSYELYYLDAGTREYFVEDRFFEISSGDFILIAPNIFHRTGTGYSVRTIVGFTESFLNKYFTSTSIIHMLKCFNKIVVSPPEEMKHEFKSLMQHISSCKNPVDSAMTLGFLLQKLSHCTADTSYDNRISMIIKYINQNFATIASIEQIADHLHISKHYLCRLFKNSTGVTLIDYINTIRVKNACDFLENSDKDILEISELCGFNSSAYFSNVFKKMMQESPLQYRKKSRK